MSSYKNSKPQRKYRERAQPQAREHLGLLQKKKDYKIRAKNYHDKQATLNKLRLKSSLANSEEFYFRMIKGKQKEGGHYELSSDEEDLDTNEYKLQLKKENANIVAMQSVIQARKVDKLKMNLHLIDTPSVQRVHKVFVNSKQELQQQKLTNTEEVLMQEEIPLVSESHLETANLSRYAEIDGSRMKQKYNKLAETLEKSDKMKKMYLKIDYEKKLLSKERRRIKKHKDGSTSRKFFMERKK